MTRHGLLVTELRRRMTRDEVLEVLYLFGGDRWSLPTPRAYLQAEREEAIQLERAEGATYDDLARVHDLSDRHVRRIVHPRPKKAA